MICLWSSVAENLYKEDSLRKGLVVASKPAQLEKEKKDKT